MQIQYVNRLTGQIEEEKVLGDALIRMAYSPSGMWWTDHVLSKRWVSQAAGWFQNRKWSASKIPEFVRDYNIQMEEFEPGPFENFNAFFTRRFKPECRTFDANEKVFCNFAESRILLKENISLRKVFKVKNAEIDLPTLCGGYSFAKNFDGGSLLIARLCPVDYHRFHFPCDGVITSFEVIHGNFHSVNPLAIESRPGLLMKNERQATLMSTAAFGMVGIIEVGALCVGTIHQTHSTRGPAKKGTEKGYFLFGGSTVVVVTQKDAVKWDSDILENSANNLETWVPLGQRLGIAQRGQT